MRQTPELGRFQVVRELGRGGMGVVYEVRDPELPGRALALKLLLSASDANALARFAREAQVLARVRHAGVVGVHAFDRTARGEPYLLTDLVPGRDLVAHVQATGRLTPVAAAALVRDVADAMAAVHAAGVIHRDLKPGNVLIRTDDGVPVVIDFGLACAADASRLTATGTVMGTVAFMPPEQAGGAVVDARADVYGLGAVLYWLLTGRAPFGGPPLQAMFALLHKEPPWPAEVDPSTPRGLDAICRQTMAKDPADRPADAAALRDALARWLAGGEPLAASSPRRARQVGVALAALAGVGALGLAVTTRRGDPAAPPRMVEATSIAVEETGALTKVDAPPVAVLDPAWRRTWAGGTWVDEPGCDLQVRFLDDDRLITVPDYESRVTVHTISHAFPERRPRRFEVDEHGGVGVVRAAPGQVLFATRSSLWSCSDEQPTRLWAHDKVIEALAFEPGTGRVAFAGRFDGPTLLALDGAKAAVVDALALEGEAMPYGIAFCRGRVVMTRRASSGGGELIVWSPGAPPQVERLPEVASLAVRGDGPLVAVGLRSQGRIRLFDVSEPSARELMTIELDPLLMVTAGTQILACTFSPTHLWACTPRGLWSWPLEGAALAPVHDSFRDVPADFGSPCSIDVSPDGALLALGGKSGTVLVRGVEAPP